MLSNPLVPKNDLLDSDLSECISEKALSEGNRKDFKLLSPGNPSTEILSCEHRPKVGRKPVLRKPFRSMESDQSEKAAP
jgi:hypothetical protein